MHLHISLSYLLNFHAQKHISSTFIYLLSIHNFEYACPVWHFGLKVDQSNRLDILQKRALRIIYSQGKVPYLLLLKEFCLPIVAPQSVSLCTNFGNNAYCNPNFQCILPAPRYPPKPCLSQLKTQKIPALNPVNARTEHYRKSFVPAFIEIINK